MNPNFMAFTEVWYWVRLLTIALSLYGMVGAIYLASTEDRYKKLGDHLKIGFSYVVLFMVVYSAIRAQHMNIDPSEVTVLSASCAVLAAMAFGWPATYNFVTNVRKSARRKRVRRERLAARTSSASRT